MVYNGKYFKNMVVYKYEIKQCIIIIIGVNRYRYVYYIYLFFGFLTNNYQRFLQLSDKYFKFIAFSIYIYIRFLILTNEVARMFFQSFLQEEARGESANVKFYILNIRLFSVICTT